MDIFDYNVVQSELLKYKNSIKRDEKKKYMEQLLIYLGPLIKKKIRHYFGKVDEDLLQCGYAKAIELTDAFDLDRDIRYIGYMQRMMGCYFYDIRKKQAVNEAITLFDESYISPEYDNGYEEIECRDLLECLNDSQKYLIIQNIMYQRKLKDIAEELEISYAYSKEVKREALKKLKDFSNNMI